MPMDSYQPALGQRLVIDAASRGAMPFFSGASETGGRSNFAPYNSIRRPARTGLIQLVGR